MYDSLADILIISETKLDESFPNTQFRIPAYSIYRKDRNGFGGGLLVYINSLLPHYLRKDYDNMFSKGIESLLFEVINKKRKWLLLAIYKPPNISDTVFISSVLNVF